MNRATKVLVVLLFLAACTTPPTPPTPQSLSTSTQAFVVSTATFTAIPSATFSATVPSPSSTPEICDPLAVGYCISDGHFIFQRPVKLPANTSVDGTYRYASTANGTRDPHHGVEFLNQFGTPVYAAGDGVVVFAGPDDKPVYSPWTNYYGNLVVTKHAENLYTLYAHLSKVTVEKGESVQSGEQIGEVGQTGVAIGSHLHFEVRQGDAEDYSTENPELWLVPNQDGNGQPLGVIQIAALNKDESLAKNANFTIQYFDDQNQPTDDIHYGMTYSADMLKGEENAAIGDLHPGKYRIVLQYNGQHFERWVEVESGKLTQVVFVAK